MPRRPSIIPTVDIHLCLPTDVKAQIDLHLFSAAEGRIPRGAYSKFFEQLSREFFNNLKEPK